MILWSIRTFWYKGLAKHHEKCQVIKTCLLFVKIAAQVRGLTFQKSVHLVFGV